MTHEAWYETLVRGHGCPVAIQPSDWTVALESALRRRARKDGRRLHTALVRASEPYTSYVTARLVRLGAP